MTDLTDLRNEYMQCAEDARTIIHAVWQNVSIFLSAIILGLALVTAQLIDRATKDHDWLTFGLVLAVGIVGATMALGLIGIRNRQQWLAAITYERMRHIERKLEMRKNIYIDVLDNWSDEKKRANLSDEDQQILLTLHRSHPRPKFYGGFIINGVAYATAFGFLALVLTELSIALWNH